MVIVFNSFNENFALFVFWIQLVAIAALSGIYFMSLLMFFCLMGLSTIFAYYGFNVFMPNLCIPICLTVGWVAVSALYGVSLALYFGGTLIPIVLMGLSGILSHFINRRLSHLWKGKL